MFPTNLTPEFSYEAMRQMLLVAGASYSKAAEAESIARANGATSFFWIESKKTDTQAFVASNDTDVAVSVRGTSSLRDALTDCEFLRRRWYPVPGVALEIHDGFADAEESIRDDVRDALFSSGLNRVNKRIWGGAHSLGAGVICPLSIYIRENLGLPINGIYTFGKPRTGNAVYRDYYNRSLGAITFCIENENDIVTRVPGVIAGFRKEGTICFMDAFGKVDVNPGLITKLASDAWPFVQELISGHSSGLVTIKNFETALTDHYLDAYKKRIFQA